MLAGNVPIGVARQGQEAPTEDGRLTTGSRRVGLDM
jgi:hypothetical protein